jgi:Transcription factor WhiB
MIGRHRFGATVSVGRVTSAQHVLTDAERLGLGAAWYESPPPGAWIRDAECRHHPDLASAFTDAVHNDNVALARSVCSGCPVRLPCLSYGRQLQATGIWGGEMLYRGNSRGRRSRE